jgi:hypothetical protein
LTSGCGNFSEAFQPPELFVSMRSSAFALAHSLFCDNFRRRRVSSRLAQALTFAAAILLAEGFCGPRGAPAQESGPIVVNSVLELEADDLADTAGVLAPFASFEEGSTIVIDLGARDLEVGPQGAILVPPSRQFAFPDPPAFGPEESQGRGLGSRRPAGPERWGSGWGDDDDHHGGGGHHGDDDDDDHHHGQSGDRGSPHLWIKSSGSLIVRAPSEPDRAGRSGGERNGGGHHDDDDNHHGGHDDDDDDDDDHGGPNLPRGKGAIETSARKGRAGDILLDFSGSVVVLGSVRSIQEKDPNNSVSTAGAITIRSAGGDVIVGAGGLVANWGEKPGTGPISLVSCGGDVAVQGLVLNRKGLFAHHPPVINVASFAGDVHIDGGALALNDFQPAGPKMDLTGGLMTFAKGAEAAGRIDIEAAGDVFISRDTTGVSLNRESQAAVANIHHENEGDNGGAIRVRSLAGSISVKDRALEAVGKKNNSEALIELFAEQDITLLSPSAPSGQNSPTINVDHVQNSHHARGGICRLRARSGSVILQSGTRVKAERTEAATGPGGTAQVNPGAFADGLQTQVEQAQEVEGLFGDCGDFGELPSLPMVGFNPIAYTVSEAAGKVTLVVELSGVVSSSSGPISVSYATQDGTAQSGEDYESIADVLVFEPGVTSKTIEIPILSDQNIESNEEFTIILLNPINVDLNANFIATTIIENYDFPLIGFGMSNLGFNESSGLALLLVEISKENFQDTIRVNYISQNVTAIAPDDYTTITGVIEFLPGEPPIKFLGVPIVVDNIEEENETFSVILSNPINAILDLDICESTIIQDHPIPLPIISFRESAISIQETDGIAKAILPVDLIGSVSEESIGVTFFVLSDGLAEANLDFAPTSGYILFEPGETEKTIEIPILPDQLFEPDETFSVIFSEPPSNARVGIDKVTVTIVNLPIWPTISFVEPYVELFEEENDTTATLRVELTGPDMPIPISINYNTDILASFAATPGVDFEAVSGTLIFEPNGEKIKTIEIPILSDGEDGEPDELIAVMLSSPTNANVTGAIAVVAIADPFSEKFPPATPELLPPGGGTVEGEVDSNEMACFKIESLPGDGHLLAVASVEAGSGNVNLIAIRGETVPGITYWDFGSFTSPSDPSAGDLEKIVATLDTAPPLEEGPWIICVHGIANEDNPDAPIPFILDVDSGPGDPPAEPEPADEDICQQRRPISGFSGTDTQSAFFFNDPSGAFAPLEASTWNQHHYALWCFELVGFQYTSTLFLRARAPQAGPQDRIALGLRASCAGGGTLDEFGSAEGSAAEGVEIFIGTLFGEFPTVVVDATAPLDIELSWEASEELQPNCDVATLVADPCAQPFPLFGYSGVRRPEQKLALDASPNGISPFPCVEEGNGFVGEYFTAFSLTTSEAGFIDLTLRQDYRETGDLAAVLRSCCSEGGLDLACARSQPGQPPSVRLLTFLPAPGTYTVLVNASRFDPAVTALWNSEFPLSLGSPGDCAEVLQITPTTNPDNPVALPNKSFIFADIAVNETHYYVFDVPEEFSSYAALNLTLASPLGSGFDSDLYVRRGQTPTLEAWDFRPYVGGGGEERVAIHAQSEPTLQAGQWRVAVHGVRSGSYRLKATFSEPNFPPLLPANRETSQKFSVTEIECAGTDSPREAEIFCDPKSDIIDIDVFRGKSNQGFSEEYRNNFGALVPANSDFDKEQISCYDGLPMPDNYGVSQLVDEIGINCPLSKFNFDPEDDDIVRGRISHYAAGYSIVYSKYLIDEKVDNGFKPYRTIYLHRADESFMPIQRNTNIFGGYFDIEEPGESFNFLVEALRHGATPFGPKIGVVFFPEKETESRFDHKEIIPIWDVGIEIERDSENRIIIEWERVRMRVVDSLWFVDIDNNGYVSSEDIRSRAIYPGWRVPMNKWIDIDPFAHLGGGKLTNVFPPETPQVYLEQKGPGKLQIQYYDKNNVLYDVLTENMTQSVDLAQRMGGWDDGYAAAFQPFKIRRRQAGTVELTFKYVLDNFVIDDTILITDAADLDIDSDNDNGYQAPERDDEEDYLEDLEGEFGKVVFPNVDDNDSDGVPDFADFQIGAYPGGTPVRFVPLPVALPAPGTTFAQNALSIDPAKAVVIFYYKDSDPNQIDISQGEGGNTIYEPAPGQFRIWTKNAGELRNPAPITAEGGGGDFVPAGLPLRLSSLVNPAAAVSSSGETVWTFYIEGGVDLPVPALGNESITMRVYEAEEAAPAPRQGGGGPREDVDASVAPATDAVVSDDIVRAGKMRVNLIADINNDGEYDPRFDDDDSGVFSPENNYTEITEPGLIISYNNNDSNKDDDRDWNDNEFDGEEDKKDMRELILKATSLLPGQKLILRKENVDNKGKIRLFELDGTEFLGPEDNERTIEPDRDGFFEGMVLLIEGVEPGQIDITLENDSNINLYDTITVNVPNIKGATAISFKNYLDRTICSDTGDLYYTPYILTSLSAIYPIWVDTDNNGTPSIQYPIMYKREEYLEIHKLLLRKIENLNSNNWQIRGSFFGTKFNNINQRIRIDFPPTEAHNENLLFSQFGDSIINNIDFRSSFALPNEVTYFGDGQNNEPSPLNIIWEYSPDNGNRWYYAGETSNFCYVTYDYPKNRFWSLFASRVCPRFHTLIHNGCKFASGLPDSSNSVDSEEIQIKKAIWEGFSKKQNGIIGPIYKTNIIPMFGLMPSTALDIQNPLSYYENWESSEHRVSTEALLQYRSASCGAWVCFMLDMTRLQGIRNVEGTNNFMKMEPDVQNLLLNTNVAGLIQEEDSTGFVVKNWTFINNNSTIRDYITARPRNFPFIGILKRNPDGSDPTRVSVLNNKYIWAYENEIRDNEGVPGHNQLNPHSLFKRHNVAINFINNGPIDNKIYDPSYGVYYDSINDFKIDSLEGYYLILEQVNLKDYEVGIDFNGDNISSNGLPGLDPEGYDEGNVIYFTNNSNLISIFTEEQSY